MNSNILELSEARVKYYLHQLPDDDTLRTLISDNSCPMFSLFRAVGYSMNKDDYTPQEHLDFIYGFIDQCQRVCNIELTTDQRNLCAVELLMWGGHSAINEPLVAQMVKEAVVTEVEEQSWLWYLREHAKYTWLNYLSSSITDCEQVLALIEELRANQPVYQQVYDNLMLESRI